MDLMMRNGVLGTVMCLVGIQSAVECQLNWKNSKVGTKQSQRDIFSFGRSLLCFRMFTTA